MRIRNSKLLVFTPLFVAAALLYAQQHSAPRPEDTEVWTPVPDVVAPGVSDAAPPSDAIVLFNGKNLDEWVSTKDKSPANWTVADGVLTVKKAPGIGNIETSNTQLNEVEEELSLGAHALCDGASIHAEHTLWEFPLLCRGPAIPSPSTFLSVSATSPSNVNFKALESRFKTTFSHMSRST